jgi:hypothetical protein
MPGPHGILSLQGDLKRAFDCDLQAIQIVAKVQAADDREEITTVVAQYRCHSNKTCPAVEYVEL